MARNQTAEQYARSKYIMLQAKEPMQLMDFLMKEMSGISRNRAKDLLRGHAVMVDRKLVTQYDFMVQPGQSVLVSRHKRSTELQNKYVKIIYEDKDLIVIEKSEGILSMASAPGQYCVKTILDEYFRSRHFPCTAHVIHRLDRPVSGVILFAKTSKALSRMTQLVKERDFSKCYWAVVKNAPARPAATLVDWLVKDEAHNKSRVVPEGTHGAKLASLDYRVVAVSDGGYTLLEVDLHTGRHHQIRCQLAHMGSPIKGDLKYGAPRSNTDGSISLHARTLSFSHPVTHSQITITAPCPDIERMFNMTNN